jgi:CHAT domain-containing protein
MPCAVRIAPYEHYPRPPSIRSSPAATRNAAPFGILARGIRPVVCRSFAALLPVSVSYIDDPQALQALLGLEQAPRILHLSAHSELDREPTIFSSLQQTEAMLTIEQCYDLRLAGSELVVLHGCTTASGMESGGALLAFQTALLVAGAQRVMTSLWPLRDELAAPGMAAFYQQIAAGQAPAHALSAAQRALIQHPTLHHPATWAGYALVRR